MTNSSNQQPENPQGDNASADNALPTGETLSRAAEEGIEPSHKAEDPEAERDEMRRDADAGAGS